jgi:Cof subfamily protein (haloacid dehalogenase superfamily)
LDGTALDTTGLVRPATIVALNHFRAKGGKVGIASGRTRDQARFAVKSIKTDLPLILFNGSVISMPNGSIDSLVVLGHLDHATKRTCLDNLWQSRSIDGLIFHYPNISIADRQSDRLLHFLLKSHITLTLRDTLPSSDSLVKVLVVCQNSEATREMLRRIIPQTSIAVISSGETVEILQRGTSKTVALEEIGRQMSFSLSEVMAFGDSENDLELIKRSGLGLATSNARRDVLDAADIILGANYTDGIAKWIEFMLGN